MQVNIFSKFYNSIEMNRAVRLILLLICFLCVQLSRTQDHLKLKRLTTELINAIAEANSGKKYGTQWVSSLGKALEEVHTTSSRRCFLFKLLVKKVETLCPKPPAPPSSKIQAPPHPSFELVYPDGSYFPWCYMPFCPTICQPPYCYPCVLPNCNPSCVPPTCFPPCKAPACQMPPTCWKPYCPNPCTYPKCIPGNSGKGSSVSCLPPYCPPPIDCTPPYCPKTYKPEVNTNINIITARTGLCPMRDIVKRVSGLR